MAIPCGNSKGAAKKACGQGPVALRQGEEPNKRLIAHPKASLHRADQGREPGPVYMASFAHTTFWASWLKAE